MVDSSVFDGSTIEMAEITFPAGGREGAPHRHGSTELIYVISGVLDHVVDSTRHRLTPGMIGLVRQGEEVAHQVRSDTPVRALVVWLPAGELARIGGAFRERPALVREGDSATGLAMLRTRWIDAYQRGDSAAMADLYVRDAVRMPYDAAAQTGRDAVLAGYGISFRTRRLIPSIELVHEEIQVVGARGVERGSYRELLRPRGEGGTTLLEIAKYVSLMRREADGTWRYEWSIFNRDAPPRPANR